MLLKKPYEHYIYDDLVEMNPSWLQSMKDTVSVHIHKIQEAVKKEAEEEGDEELLDPDNLYSRFKFNKEHDMKVGNIRLLKYFVANLVIKVYRESIGFWEYTEEDKEMYDYFRWNLGEIEKVSRGKFVTFNNEDVVLYLPMELTTEYKIYAELDSNVTNNILEVNYFDFFSKRIISVLDLISIGKGMKPQLKKYDFFKEDEPFVSEILSTVTSPIRKMYVKRPLSNYDKWIDIEKNSYVNFMKILSDELNKEEEYLKIKESMLKCVSPILERVIKDNFELFDSITEKDKVKIRKLGSYVLR